MLKTVSVAMMRIAARGGCEQRLEAAEVAVRIAAEGGAREDGAVVQAGVVQPVGEDFGGAVRERRENAEVGGVAAGKEERARHAA